MKTKGLITIVFLLLTQQIFATTYVIQFGGTVGMKYSPDSLNAKVGDIIRWEGSFSSHPLVSTSVPSGATPITVSTGVSFEYTLMKSGDYRYWCDIHQFKGVLKVAENADITNPTLKNISIFYNSVDKSLHLPENKEYTLRVFDIKGNSVLECQSAELVELAFLKQGTYIACLFKENEMMHYLRFFAVD
jgi:plastocyanin